MRVPTHLLQPLSVDTSTSYDLDMSRFPGLDDPRYKNEPVLMVARRETNYIGYNNTSWTCSGRRESAFSSFQTMQRPDAGSASRCPPLHSSVHPVHNIGVPEDLLEIIDLPNQDLLGLLDTKQYEILVDDLSQDLNRQDPLPDLQILAVEQRRDTLDERQLYTNYHRPDLHATPFEQRSCYQTEIPQQHLRNTMPYSKTTNTCKNFKGYMYPTYSLTSNRCVAVNAPNNSFGSTLVNPVGDKPVAAVVRNKRKWSNDSDSSHKRRCLQPRHVDYLGQYSVIRQGSQIGVM
ncbi:uncharacterized protein [Haliotis asinina]|uniref:uncharacterized protein n=1 Tax=Haliotis asinina TaxID=109174 RepID=UPI003531C8EC